MTTSKPWTGVFPIAPTPFADNGDVDLDGQRRVLDCMIDQGVDGICILANYSEQFLLTDARARHADRSVPVACRRPRAGDRDLQPFLAPASRPNARSKAAKAGASMLMMMPPYHGTGLRADENGMIEHFARVADAARIPIMVQDAPLSGVNLSVPFLVRLAQKVPLVALFQDRSAGHRGQAARPDRSRAALRSKGRSTARNRSR